MAAVYIHIPFCLKKCNYCAFNSYTKTEFCPDEFVQALKKEIRIWGKENDPFLFPVSSLFLGGGTPTCLTFVQLEEILRTCREVFILTPEAEITVEANPGTVNYDKLLMLKENGVNRLSFGVQSLSEKYLKFLGRIHTKEEFLANYTLARKAGFDNINLDFMFALPGQSVAEWQETLRQAAALQPEHISAYNLVLEEGTPLKAAYDRGEFQAADEETDLLMYEMTMDYLKSQGYKHYEISNFAKSNKQCRHNLVYWHNAEYWGFGAGAHSHYQGKRWFNFNRPDLYIKYLASGLKPREEEEELSLKTAMAETMMQGLRLYEGVLKADFENRFQHKITEVYAAPLEKMHNSGLIMENKDRIRLTKKGLLLANLVFAEFF